MATKLKLYIGRKVLDSFHKTPSVTAMQLKSLLQVEPSKDENAPIELSMSLSTIENRFGIANVNKILKIQPDDIIQNIHSIKDRSNSRICFQVKNDIFMKEIVEHAYEPDLNNDKKKIVTEFSSPNVAKPFHVGHLRSTIIGNFISNLHAFMNNTVVRINYLGDWGTQFGLIKVGVDDLKHSNEDIKNDPLNLLYRSYVHANALAKNDPTILEKAKLEFSKLESGSQVEIDNWKTYMGYTIDELKSTYNRLGVKFDVYNYESMYGSKEVQNVLDVLHKRKILHKEADGKEVAKVNDRSVSVLKSDGSTLYLTRDIAAAIDRFKKYEFDQMYYIVDNGQSDHFNALTSILYQMDLPWVHRLKHIKFGRIRGMSTRKGNVVFLKDILDETRDLMVQRQITSPTTKVPVSDKHVSDILGISCVIINDLKQRRQRDYEFSWDRALQVQGDSGIKLQYTHCRLWNLEKNSGVVASSICLPELLIEPELVLLIRELSRFQDVLHRAEEQLEACILVSYLFQLCNHISKALKVVRVKDQDLTLASQRLFVFNSARHVLGQGMTILGLHPLKEM
ncbi:PREDICTED: probable arginine--tRNA ligase, mitochondrial [Nicrophorus vespilloides]|uniref:Probable arginine--tRNA ligase, mitochondrial n=1 Tax=Nicrophorus vespilloides TaxID=110193 RepID=A0ABM1MKL5_NICVS|nr:PREDICTED: probable arginine--tRNA ligase, mitochondrial [Nicrophorus vespilloides]